MIVPAHVMLTSEQMDALMGDLPFAQQKTQDGNKFLINAMTAEINGLTVQIDEQTEYILDIQDKMAQIELQAKLKQISLSKQLTLFQVLSACFLVVSIALLFK